MIKPSKDERLILALLEEAGEEHLAALANALDRRTTHIPVTIQALSVALGHLIARDLIRISKFRDKVHHRLVPLSATESLVIAKNLRSFLSRSTTDQSWHWKVGESMMDVLLTDPGTAAARAILSEDGWPK